MHISTTRFRPRHRQYSRRYDSCAHDVNLQHAKRWQCRSGRTCILYDAFDTIVPYEQAWSFQKELVEHCIKQIDNPHRSTQALPQSPPWMATSSSTSHGIPPPADTTQSNKGTLGAVVLLQHPHVYTLGAGSSLEHVGFDPEDPPYPIYRTERGGEVTYHGPGQLVLYPILDLRHQQQDLHWYLRSLEEVVIRALEAVSGLQGERVEGLTGVWVGGRKLAAIGVRAKRWVTYHGLALNVTTDLTPFSHITPCGISDRPVGSVEQVLADMGQAGGYRGAGGAGRGPEAVATARQELLLEYRYAVLEAFGEVFEVDVVNAAEVQ